MERGSRWERGARRNAIDVRLELLVEADKRRFLVFTDGNRTMTIDWPGLT